jgi:Fe2+ or Zn2+ uptake regulation protein
MIPEKESTRSALRAGGLRSTGPRRLILDTVRGTDVHPPAAWVYRRVRRRLPSVSLATVYRNLRQLVDAGLLVERLDATGSRFDGNTSPHHHFTCVACSRIFDLTEPFDCVVQARIAERAGFEVTQHRIEFYGRCAACRPSTRRSPQRRKAWPASP